MQYKVTEKEAQIAKNPHHIFNLNIILTHLFMPLTILKTAGLIWFLLVPAVSVSVLLYVRFKAKQKLKTDTWFVAANWELVWRRGKILIMSYLLAVGIVLLYMILDMIIPSNFTMNNFAEEGASTTPIFQIIVMILSTVLVLIAVIITFFQTGISVFDCSQGVIDKKIANFVPRDENSNEELGEYDDRAKPVAKEDQSA